MSVQEPTLNEIWTHNVFSQFCSTTNADGRSFQDEYESRQVIAIDQPLRAAELLIFLRDQRSTPTREPSRPAVGRSGL